MKKFFTSLFALLLVAGVLGGMVWLLFNMPPAALPFVTAAIGFFASRFYESWKESKSRLYDRKREVYTNLLRPWKDLFNSTVQNRDTGKETVVTPEMIQQGTSAAFDAILYASDEVVKKYGEFRTMGSEAPSSPYFILFRVAALMKAMRKDLGYTFTNVDEVDILTMFVNFTPEERATVRQALKSR